MISSNISSIDKFLVPYAKTTLALFERLDLESNYHINFEMDGANYRLVVNWTGDPSESDALKLNQAGYLSDDEYHKYVRQFRPRFVKIDIEVDKSDDSKLNIEVKS